MLLLKRTSLVSIICLGFITSISVANAQSFEDALRPFWYFRSFGASSFALTNNNTAISKDLSSISANPANLGIIQRPSAFLSFQYGLFSQNGKLENNPNYITDGNNYFRYDGFGFVYPVPVYQGSLVLALSYAPTAQYNYILKTDGFINRDSVSLSHYINESGIMNSLQLGTSVEFKKNLFLGFSANFYHGYRNYKYTGTDIDTEDIYTYSNYVRNETIKPNYTGWNINTGILYRLPYLKFGLRISSPLKLNVHEKSKIDSTTTSDNLHELYGSKQYDLTYKTTFPIEISTSIALTLYDITIAFDFATRDWGNINFRSNLYTDTTFTEKIDPGINNDIRLNLKTTTDWGIGLIIPFWNTLSVQLGYRILPRPYYNLPDNEKYITLMGFGIEGIIEDQIVMGISYQISMGRQTIENTYFKTYTTQQLQDHQLTVSTSLLF